MRERRVNCIKPVSGFSHCSQNVVRGSSGGNPNQVDSSLIRKHLLNRFKILYRFYDRFPVSVLLCTIVETWIFKIFKANIKCSKFVDNKLSKTVYEVLLLGLSKQQ